MPNDNGTSKTRATATAEPAPAGSLRDRAEHLGLTPDPDAPLQELAEAVQQRLALVDRLDESVLREILAWAHQPAPAGATKEELVRRIAGVRKWNYHRLSHKALLSLALLRDLPVRPDTPAADILKALRSGESLRQRLRRKRRALLASLIGKVMGLPAAPAASAPGLADPQPAPIPAPDLKEQILERGVVRGLATTIRGVTDDYIRQKLDEIEQRIDRKLDEIDRRLQEWRDREIANRLRIIKITLAASIVVALLSFGYSWIQSHVVRAAPGGTPAVAAPGPSGATAVDGPGAADPVKRGQ